MRVVLKEFVSKPPKKRHLLIEGRSLFELGASSMLMPLLMQAPRGDKHPVLVIPGFMASDISTKPLRTFLSIKGYNAKGWGLGRNLGTHIVGGSNIVSDSLLNAVIEINVRHNTKVSIIGWSLGGILAREIARVIPECIRQVISLGSPFNGPVGSAPVASKMFEAINGNIAEREPLAANRMIKPPPVPSTAIYSKSDGIAHWEACKNNQKHLNDQAENIEVNGSHSGLGHNAQVIWIVANRLSQPQGHWRPFKARSIAKLMFPNPTGV